jgi:hypothetical protein
MRGPWDIATTGRIALKSLSALLTFSILAQFFIAGMSAMTNPQWWTYHSAWVAIFQWLVVPLPIFAWLEGPPRRSRTAFAALPLVQIALQYVLVHRALDGRLPIGVGLHALNAALMLLVATALAVGFYEPKN